MISWQPPSRLRYLWHIYGSRERATEVEIRFEGEGRQTRVRVLQSGFDRLGAEAESLRERNHAGWSDLFGYFVAACAAPKAD